ncbi:unknown [Bacteroides sp. CAG:633]|nr:unknown [Bacteroides sp. CAG:633]
MKNEELRMKNFSDYSPLNIIHSPLIINHLSFTINHYKPFGFNSLTSIKMPPYAGSSPRSI